jgi:RNA polymerase sigma-19 factor, ECF subfamily
MSVMPVADPLQQQIHTLYTAHHGWLLSWLRRRMGGAELAADLAHDTFVRLIEARVSRIDEPRAFLTTLARRVLVSHFRRAEIERAYLENLAQLPEGVAPSPETVAIVVETLLEIDTLLDGLPPKVRAAFLMAQLDGMPYAEIAVRLEVSVSSIKQYMARAIRQCYFAMPVASGVE